MSSPKFIKVNHEEEITTPFDGDLWERKALADRLEQFIEPLNIGMTIALDAEWGAGKTWFVKHWMKQLKDHEFKVLHLDAFAQDYIEDPFVSISMEIAKCLEDEKDGTEKFIESIGDIYRAALPSLPMILWALTTTLMGAGALAKPVADMIERLKDGSGNVGEEVGTLLNDQLKEHLSAQVENYDNEKKSLQFFKNELVRLTQDLPKPLVFVIDELDRCKPEFAIRLIERIKHFFDVPNIVFVLSVNKKQLEQSINSFYGFSEDANYLEKFVDITVHLKNKFLSSDLYERILKEYADKLGLNLQNNSYLSTCIVFKPNARQLIRVLNKFSFLKAKYATGRAELLFIILIFLEKNLIKEFNEKSFFEYFMNEIEKTFKSKYDQSEYGRSQSYDFYNFLSHFFRNLSGLFQWIKVTKNLNNQTDIEQYKHIYMPDHNYEVDMDLIEEWVKYIHVVVD